MSPGKPSSESGRATAADDLSVLDGLVQLSFVIQAALGSIAASFDLSIIQTRMLGILRDRQPGMLELARMLNLEKSSVSGLVDRAERRGLVQRRTSPDDGRAIRVALTPEGHQLARAFVEAMGRRLEVFVEGLDDTDRRKLAALASHIVFQDAVARGLDLRT